MKRFLMIFVAFALFQGCMADVFKHELFNEDKTQAYQLEEIVSVSAFGPTYQYQRAKMCDVKATLVKSNEYSSGYTKHEAVNCKLMTSAQGWNKDLGTPTGPSVMQTGTGLGGAALIADGIRDQSDTTNINNGNKINNSNSQGQIQGQSQRSFNSNYNSNRNYNTNKNYNSNSNCNGFFC